MLRGLVTFVALGEHTFMILSLAPAERFGRYADTFQRAHASFATLTDPRLRELQPARIELIEVREPDSLRALYQRDPASVSLQEIALLNQLEPEARLARGELVKWVRGGGEAR